MAQFDLFVNPIPSARSVYPYIVTMQADWAETPTYQVVAPMVARGGFPHGRLTPKVEVEGKEHVVLVPHMTVMRSRDLKANVGSLAGQRTDILAAVDFLFFGV